MEGIYSVCPSKYVIARPVRLAVAIPQELLQHHGIASPDFHRDRNDIVFGKN